MKHIQSAALSIAVDPAVTDEVISLAIAHLQEGLVSCAEAGEPIQLHAYKTKRVLNIAATLRRQAGGDLRRLRQSARLATHSSRSEGPPPILPI